MEILVAGKPVVAWPMVAEQHLNARHVVDIIGAGIRMDLKDDMVERTEIEEKVKNLMDTDEVGKRMRMRATWARKMATSVVSVELPASHCRS
jgi:UDP:flavonoid glycosyltransferase YjiC (YdhE family)